MIDLVFAFVIICGLTMLMMAIICAYQDTQSRIKWRESTSLENIEMVKREAVNEYISKQVDDETIHNTRADRQADWAGA